MLLELLGDRSGGTYADIGAFHPRWGSNTHALHRRGWRGLNIDARPGSMAPFARARPCDVNLEIGIGAVEGVLDFHVFADDELSTFDAELARRRVERHRRLAVVQVPVRRLGDVLAEHLPDGVDVLSIDVEGVDLEQRLDAIPPGHRARRGRWAGQSGSMGSLRGPCPQTAMALSPPPP